MTNRVEVVAESEPFLSVAEAAKKAGQTRSKIYGWIRWKDGLSITRQGRRIYVAKADLEAFMRKHRVATASADEDQRGKQEPSPVPRSGLNGQRELRHLPRRLGGRAFFCVPEWRAIE